ncbi:hypothetical protein MLAC_12600 [Mycobacterium lacus]|uniref:Transposase n=1 Tax=Mycobacterium lacus TaxID=169765 RepID=A0A7I7NH43_9MYCO|nr:hypothetical protein [Mycobacterium lacus]BBX95966.1 hypothetical protein MLAC_12600 [Mycobacterium lacus]
MPRNMGKVHVVRVKKTHVDKQGRRRDYESVYLRRTFRDGAKVRNETVANLSMLPAASITALEATLKGQALIPAGSEFTKTRSLPHGHVAAVSAMAHRLGFPALLGPACRSRDVVFALIISRVIRPASSCPPCHGGPIPRWVSIWTWRGRRPTRSTRRWTGWRTAKMRSSANWPPNT